MMINIPLIGMSLLFSDLSLSVSYQSKLNGIDLSSASNTQGKGYASKKRLQIEANNTQALISTHTKIDLNKADILLLQRLPGIGPKRAASIVKYRESIPGKRFQAIEQLLNVKGITVKRLESIRAKIVLK